MGDINIDAFTTADTDGNLCLNWNELQEYKIKIDPALRSDPQLIQQHLHHFTKADADKSGCITWKEAMDWKTQEENGKTGQTGQRDKRDRAFLLTSWQKLRQTK